MKRSQVLYGVGLLAVVLVVVAVIYIARRPPDPGTAAAFRQMSAASGYAAPYSVPMELRRQNADTCVGYNLELEEAAGIQRRINNNPEAERLLAMRQTCNAAPAVIRSAR